MQKRKSTPTSPSSSMAARRSLFLWSTASSFPPRKTFQRMTWPQQCPCPPLPMPSSSQSNMAGKMARVKDPPLTALSCAIWQRLTWSVILAACPPQLQPWRRVMRPLGGLPRLAPRPTTLWSSRLTTGTPSACYLRKGLP